MDIAPQTITAFCSIATWLNILAARLAGSSLLLFATAVLAAPVPATMSADASMRKVPALSRLKQLSVFGSCGYGLACQSAGLKCQTKRGSCGYGLLKGRITQLPRSSDTECFAASMLQYARVHHA
jgi:hypothetical protein